MANRLVHATSPYLLQHADNPVDWWQWEPAAFEQARRRDVPVFLSVGYSACHWCHVLAHESFEDEATAAYMNENFVNIKVDREERPDVDAVYMEAVQAATGQGGWPMSVFMTADGEPFYFGTYFPPRPRQGMPSFRQVLEGVHGAWTSRRAEVGEVAQKIARDLAGRQLEHAGAGLPGDEELAQALLSISREYDPASGWLGGGDTRFPPSMVIEFLLRHHARTGSDGALEMAGGICAAMARSSLFDQLGGGFHRYVLRERPGGPLVPHFEKMLYDNALLCRAYAHLWRATGSPLARRVALRTADFMVRELGTAEGAFASALDADSAREDSPSGEHAEGAFYVWTRAQLREVLGEADAAFAAACFGVTDDGSFRIGDDRASVLHLPEPERDPDADLDAAPGSGPGPAPGPAGERTGTPGGAGGERGYDDRAEYDERVESVRERLFAARGRRPAPGRDDKVVAAWNGLAVAALAETGAYFDRPDLVEAAAAAADLLVRVHLDEQARLIRTSRDGRAGANAGVLEDYADVAEGFLTLASVTGEGAWLRLAGVLLDQVRSRFTGEQGELYDTAADAEQLIRRPQDPTDNAVPSGWSAAAGALLSYAAHTGSEEHRTAAERALSVVKALGPRAARFVGWGLAVAEAALDGPREVAVVGAPDDPATGALRRAALLGTAPGAVLAFGEPDSDELPLLADRPLVRERPAAYVCRHFTCDAPTTHVAALRRAVGAREAE